MDEDVSFGSWVRHRRRILDITQADLAQKVNCSLSMLRKIERDERRPSDQLAELLADHLAIDDSQRSLFLQMARGTYVPDMPAPARAEFNQAAVHQPAAEQPADHQPAAQRSLSGNPFIISSAAVLLLALLLLLLSGVLNSWFGLPAANSGGESIQPSDGAAAGQNGTTIENEDSPPTPTALNKTAAELTARPLAGTTVTVGGFYLEILALYEESFRPFEEETGIHIELVDYGADFESVIDDVVASGLKPDIIRFPQPGYLAEFAQQGEVVDLHTFMDDAFLEQQYSKALLESATVNGQMAGLWNQVNVKSLVWYPKQVFEAAGYEEPQTWEELMALTKQIAGDGRTPWCIGMEDGEATGWVGTDWLENILLRTEPPETYDAWVAGELPFNSPEIRSAFEIMAEIWMEDDYLYGGVPAILNERFYESAQHLFEEPPGCYLHSQGSFALSFIAEDAMFGRDYDFFLLPAIDAEYGRPVLGGGDIYAMFNDRPEVREVMRFLASGESVKPFVESGNSFSPHRDAEFEWYATPAHLKIAQMLLEADTYRFDGSDMMPGVVGAGSFWHGIVDWVEGEDLDVVLKGIDDSWPER